jgi:hypothetical protein
MKFLIQCALYKTNCRYGLFRKVSVPITSLKPNLLYICCLLCVCLFVCVCVRYAFGRPLADFDETGLDGSGRAPDGY